MNKKVKKMMTIAILSAVAFAAVATIRIPIILFLSYEPKDVIITLGGFLMGPVSVFIMSVVVSFIEMITISNTGPIGFIMNVLATCSFAGVTVYVYQKKKTLKGAILGLVAGVLTMTATMLAWNYLITPIYMKIPRAVVSDMLIPYFLPFNLLKGGINAAIVMLIYKPLVVPLFNRFNLMDTKKTETKINMGIVIGSLFVLATCIFFVLVLKGIV